MTGATWLLPELETVLRHGSAERRATMLHRLTTLFLDGAGWFGDDHVRLFDDVLGPLLDEIEGRARSELAHRLAPLGNAPAGVIRRLAVDDDIAVAAPVLELSPRLGEADLVAVATTKGQGHLLAITARPRLPGRLTDVLIRRGDDAVARRVAGHADAAISDTGFLTLVQRAAGNGALAIQVGQRPDLPPSLFGVLVSRVGDGPRRRLLAAAGPEALAEIRQAITRVGGDGHRAAPPRNYAEAERTIDGLRRAGQLGEPALMRLARAGQVEETVACLAALCALPVPVVDGLMAGERTDGLLILGKARPFDWITVQAVLSLAAGARGLAPQSLENAHANFERLSADTARRVVQFWRARGAG